MGINQMCRTFIAACMILLKNVMCKLQKYKKAKIADDNYYYDIQKIVLVKRIFIAFFMA